LIEQGALYPGLFRLVRQGLLKASWGTSENNRRAKFYELTAAGRKRLREETPAGSGWRPPSALRSPRNPRKYDVADFDGYSLPLPRGEADEMNWIAEASPRLRPGWPVSFIFSAC